MKYFVIAALALMAAACSGGRYEPGGSMFDPLCMPDGSVVYYEYPNKAGTYDEVKANKANCPWNRPSRNRAHLIAAEMRQRGKRS